MTTGAIRRQQKQKTQTSEANLSKASSDLNLCRRFYDKKKPAF